MRNPTEPQIERPYPHSDAELIRRTLEGDRTCFDTLVSRYRDQVYRLVYFRVRRRDEAEDLAQDAFVAAYGSLHHLRDRDRFGPWLRRIAENACNMWLRRYSGNAVPLEEHHVTADDSSTIQSWLINTQIHDALSHLSETNRLAATLYFVDGLSYKDIAEFLDVPVGTIKRRINLSRTQLKKELIDLMKDTIGPEKPATEFTAGVATKIDVLRWYRRFGEYISAGQSLVISLEKLAAGDFADDIRRDSLALKSAVEQGETLSKALKTRAPTLKHPIVEGMIRSGEIGGILEESCRMIVAWMERDDMSLRVDAAYWLRTLSFVLSAGVPIVWAVDEMERVSPSEPLKQVLATLRESLLAGASIADALAGFGGVFSPAVIALLRAGEKAGLLEVALAQASSDIMREAYEQMRDDPLLRVNQDKIIVLTEGVRSQLASPLADVRIGALQALEQLEGTGASDDYMAGLYDGDADVRLTAARILGRHPSPRALRAVVIASADQEPRVREAALLALPSLDRDQALESAKTALADEAVDVRRAAVRILALKKTPESAGLLAQALFDRELLVTSPATDALVAFGEVALAPLMKILEEPDRAPMGAWDAIPRIDPEAARKLSRQLLQEEQSGVHRQALKMLSQVAEPQDAAILAEALVDEDTSVVRDAISALGKLKASGAVSNLIRLLDHPEWWLAARAAFALGEIGDKSAASALAAKLTASNDNGVISAAADALAALGAKEFSGMLTETALTTRMGPEAAARLADQPEVEQMVQALADPQTRGTALVFLRSLALTSAEWLLVRPREEGRQMARKAGAAKALVSVLGAEDSRDRRSMAVDSLSVLVGGKEAIRLINRAVDEQELSSEIAEEATRLIENLTAPHRCPGSNRGCSHGSFRQTIC